MTEILKEEYKATIGRTTMTGWGFVNESECKKYLANRVRDKLRESDTSGLLEEYLIEMADTGFDSADLQARVQRPPRAKDWEVGEAFATAMLEDRFEASFPWLTSFDKRTPKASLPGPDMSGFQRKVNSRFLFGEVKASSEAKSPPHVANSGHDCLYKQIKRLVSSDVHRQQVIEWLLVRARDSVKWKPIFDEAIRLYAEDDACICGVLVRGGIDPDADDLSQVQGELADFPSMFDVMLLAFYLPFNKSEWTELVYGSESKN